MSIKSQKEKDIKQLVLLVKKAKDYECFPVDEEIIVGKEWGDESETFLDRVDILVKIGGGKTIERRI